MICSPTGRFVKHRQGLDNVVDIDTRSRIVDMVGRVEGSIGLLALYDFLTAFPSVSHCWLFLALEAAAFPREIVFCSECYTA